MKLKHYATIISFCVTMTCYIITTAIFIYMAFHNYSYTIVLESNRIHEYWVELALLLISLPAVLYTYANMLKPEEATPCSTDSTPKHTN